MELVDLFVHAEFVHLRKPHVELLLWTHGIDYVPVLEISKYIIFTCLEYISLSSFEVKIHETTFFLSIFAMKIHENLMQI